MIKDHSPAVAGSSRSFGRHLRHRPGCPRFLLAIGGVAAVMLPLGLTWAHGTVQATNVLVPATAFEIDGNRTVDALGDWDGVYATGTTPAGYPTTGVYYMQRDEDPCATASDDVAVGGKKLDDGPVWPTTTGQPNEKTDLAAVSLAAEKVAVPGTQIEDILYMSFERCGGGSGTMSTLIALDNGDGVLPSAGGQGDYLFRFDFDPSTGATHITMLRYVAGTWTTVPVPAGAVDGRAAPEPGDFAEVALNLTTLGILDAASCRPVTVRGQAATITGGALDSQPKDIVELTPFTVSNCGALEVTKATSPAGLVSTDLFHYVVDQRDGEPVHDATLDVGAVADTGEPDQDVSEIDAFLLAGQTDSWRNVISQPDYRLTEVDVHAGWSLERITCTYSDIFQPLPNSAEVVLFEDGQYTGNEFVIPPTSFAGFALAPTSCTITNASAAITVRKAGTGDPSQAFDFAITGHDAFSLTLDQASAPFRFGAGESVTISEDWADTAADWRLDAISCVDTDGADVPSQVDLEARAVTVDTIEGTLITCTFTNVERSEADLAIEKASSTETVGPDSPFDWILTITNAGPDTATNVVVVDTLPAGVDVQAISSDVFDCVEVGNTITCTAAELAVAAAGTVTITVIAGEVPGVLENVATVDSDSDDPDPTDNEAQDTVEVVAQGLPTTSTSTTAPPTTSVSTTVASTTSLPTTSTSTSVASGLPTSTLARTGGRTEGTQALIALTLLALGMFATRIARRSVPVD